MFWVLFVVLLFGLGCGVGLCRLKLVGVDLAFGWWICFFGVGALV